MFQKIAQLNVRDDWYVELGYELPNVITHETIPELTTKIVKSDNTPIDPESIEYKQMESVAEVLRLGFDIGCAYTKKVYEQAEKMVNDLESNSEVNVTGEATDLILE